MSNGNKDSIKDNIRKTLENVEFSQNDTIDVFVNKNISYINKSLNAFSSKNLKKYLKNGDLIKFTNTDIDIFLKNKFNTFISNENNKNKLIDDLSFNDKNQVLTKKEIKNLLLAIANKRVFLESSVENFYKQYINDKLLYTFQSSEEYRKQILDFVLDINKFNKENILTESEKIFIKNDIDKSLYDMLYLAFSNGFAKNINVANFGVTNANEGDAAQFLFVSRAMLAGFNCSNVDLRSSRYDAVIDINNQILRVQVKGISKDNQTVIFKDRDRGGEGIDPNSTRNKGRIISSIDTDIYVAIKKNTGICYIIPAKDIDKLRSENNGKEKSYNLNSLNKYKENWNIIYSIAQNKKNE